MVRVHAQWLSVMQSCKAKLHRLDSLGLTEQTLIGQPDTSKMDEDEKDDGGVAARLSSRAIVTRTR
jgi:hypothetical protein